MGAVGDTLRSIFETPVMMINSYEPIFDLYRFPPTAYKGFVRKQRNIITLQTGADIEKPSITVQVDAFATPQLIVDISARDDQALIEHISQNAELLIELFSMAERERFISVVTRHNQPTLNAEIEKMFGFEMKIPPGYKIRSRNENFIWLTHEYPRSTQGIVVHSRPYTGMEDFELASLIEARDRSVSQIPGPSPGSYMITVTEYEPLVEYVRIGERLWAIMRGFWDVRNDFMGGPFVSYTTLDIAENKLVTIDNFLYSPERPKRNMLRDLEALVYMVRFPETGGGELRVQL